MATFKFELVSPERMLFSGDVQSVVVPGIDGEFQVFAGHAPMMSTLRPGVVTVAQGDGAPMRLFVRGGFADVAPSGFTVLAEQAIPLSELKPEELARSIKDAQDDLNDARSDEARSLAAERLAQLQDLQRAILN